MSVIDLVELLKPVSEDRPCGEDLEYAPEFLALLELARGKAAQEMGDSVRPAQDPPWPKVREAAEALMLTTKDLRVASVLHRALMKTDEAAGLASSLSLIAGLLDRYWEYLYPMLDAEEDNDPTFRINALVAALAGEDALAMLRTLPLVESRQFGRYSLRSYRIACGVLKIEDADGGSEEHEQDLAKIESASADMGIEGLQSVSASLRTGADALDSIQKVLLERGDGIPAELTALAAELKDMRAFLDSQLTRLGVGHEDHVSEFDSADGQSITSGSGPGVSGEIRSRGDVTRTLDRICDYYRRVEPSSPVPMLLERAQRLVDKDFMTILRDLAPAGVTEAEIIGGLGRSG